MATILYNSSYFAIAPSAAAYQHQVTDMVTVDPNAGIYDYKLDVVVDLNAVLDDFSYRRDLGTNQHIVAGEAAAWADLAALLSTGTGNAVTAGSFLTTMSDSDTTARASWDTFWAGLLSECIDGDDKDGLSVQMTTLKTRIDHPTNIGPYADVAAANAAGFLNDVTASINDAFGATTTTGGVGSVAIADNAFGTKTIQIAPSAASNFLAAAAVLLYHTHGATAAGAEGSLSGDPSDGPVKFALAPGSGFGIRISSSIVNSKTGLITVIQS
jgi:hypothetical protein